MPAFFKTHAALALVAAATACACGQIPLAAPVWPYHPSRPGAEAYFRGGAFAAETGSVTALLFNPAGLANMPGRLSLLVEGGWCSQTDYLDFRNSSFVSDFQPLQFAAVAFQPAPRYAVGAFYSQPVNFRLDLGTLETSADAPNLQREYDAVGLAFSAAPVQNLYLGGGVEWRQARSQDQFSFYAASGKADGWRLSLGVIAAWRDWQFGVAARSRYEAQGEQSLQLGLPVVIIVPQPDSSGGSLPGVTAIDAAPFAAEDPASLRFGLTSPVLIKCLRLSADAEYQDFDHDRPITRWQFYGGGTVQVTSSLQLGVGCFTFRKDYGDFIDGPQTEIFLTAGGTLTLAALRLTASSMDGDLLNQDFQGQRFLNLALGYALH